ncbi:MAG: MFS transporter [Bacteroidetes bacterium]|nr:MFS transporter [Bacteroidota bacterium]
MPAISIVLFSALVGGLADRLGRKKLLLFALLVYGLSGVSGLVISNIYLIPVQIPYSLKDHFNLSATVVGLAISVATLTGAVASLNFRKIGQHFSPTKIYALTFLCFGLGYLCIGFGGNQFLMFLGLDISGVGTGLMMPNGNFILLELLPASIKGKWLGGLTTAIAGFPLVLWCYVFLFKDEAEQALNIVVGIVQCKQAGSTNGDELGLL